MRSILAASCTFTTLAALAHTAHAAADNDDDDDAAPLRTSSPRELPVPFVELRAHLALGAADRAGVTLEPAMSYRWRRFEFGAGAQWLGLWANDDLPLDNGYPGRSYRDLTLLPRAIVGYGSRDGFWRVQLTAGYGPTWMHASGGTPLLPSVSRTRWSYEAGFGLAAGIFHAEVQWLGYLSGAEEGYSIILGEGSAVERGNAGQITSLGVAIPIALDGSRSH